MWVIDIKLLFVFKKCCLFSVGLVTEKKDVSGPGLRFFFFFLFFFSLSVEKKENLLHSFIKIN